MTWNIYQKPSFISDFIDLNKDIQKAVLNCLSELEVDPITPRGNTIKPLQGFKNVYRYRLGDYRLIYAASKKAKAIQTLAIGPRGSIYEHFNYLGWDAPGAAVEFGPEMAGEEQFQIPAEWIQPKAPEKERLPRKLTPRLLKKWRVNEAYHGVLSRCLFSEDLVNLPSDKQVPEHVVLRVMDCLFATPLDRIASQPDYILYDPQDLLRYAKGDLAGFLLRLDEQQEPLTRWALSGPTLVKGGPGSGKSTVALYRLRNVVERHIREHDRLPRVLFTTYTNALINLSESLLRQVLGDVLPSGGAENLPAEIQVSTLHRIAMQIASKRQTVQIASDRELQEAIQAARYDLQPKELGDKAKLQTANQLRRIRDSYLLDEFEWVIEGQDCRTEAAYLEADRSGRGIPFSATVRLVVWQLYLAFQHHLAQRGLQTFGGLILQALDITRKGDGVEEWDHVVVDEAQDLPPAALMLAVELCREPSGLFFTADANQSLYNRGFRWRNVHETLQLTGRTRILRHNYRSTKQIAMAAKQILEPLASFDGEALTQEYVNSGPKPVIFAAAGTEDQWKWIGQQIYESALALRLPASAAAVLVPSEKVGQPLARALREQGLSAKFMNSQQFNLDDPCIKVTTLHAAKGLEFPIVVVAHVEDGRLPRLIEAQEQDEIDAHLDEQRRLFFVGCTRAMRHLFITYDRMIPSPFLAGLDDERWKMA